MPEAAKRRVAILGGGAAGLAAAYELTRTPELREAFDVTVYQHGWRLGGKGASGRNAARNERIEEHGLHIWFGFYENAFRLLGECYEELRRQGRPKRFERCADAFLPCSRLALVEEGGTRWQTHSFPLPSTPSEKGDLRWFPAYLLRLLGGIAKSLLEPGPGKELNADATSAYSRLLDAAAHAERAAENEPRSNLRSARALGWPRSLRSRGLLAVAGEMLAVERAFASASAISVRSGELALLARLAGFAKSVIAVLAILVLPRLGRDPAPFDHLNGLEFRDLLRGAGRDGSPLVEGSRALRLSLRVLRRRGLLADEAVLDAPFVRVLYDLAFAYRDGSPDAPDVAAGVALENLVNISFRHGGVLMHKMRAGMGDVVFSPLYRLLGEEEAKGRPPRVRFEFFSAIERVDAPGVKVEQVVICRQAGLRRQTNGYRPLRDVNGLPCWPNGPLAEQLDAPTREGLKVLRDRSDSPNPAMAFEREIDPLARGERSKLQLGRDFDDVVLAIPVGAHAAIAGSPAGDCPGGIEDQAFRRAAAAPTTATNAFQVWLTATPEELGLVDGAAPGEATVVGNYRKPFDTYCDMTHLLPEESWATAMRLIRPRAPRSLAYFCGPMSRPPDDWREAERRSERLALEFLKAHWSDGDGRPFWRLRFGPELLHARRLLRGWDRFRAQYWRANVTGWERYAASHAGTMERRLRADGRRPDGRPGLLVENLVLAGDWTHTAVNAGSVEAAVTSGIEAARALIARQSSRAGGRLPEPRVKLPSWRRSQ